MLFKKKTEIDTELKRIGQIDSKPFTYLDNQLEYAKYRYIIKTNELVLRCRVYNDYLFKVVLISDFNKFDLSKTTNKYLKENNLLTPEEMVPEHSLNLYIIEENTLRTREFAKNNTFMAHSGYQLFLIANSQDVMLDYYNMLPEYDFNLMKYLRTMLYFDLACHDEEDY